MPSKHSGLSTFFQSLLSQSLPLLGPKHGETGLGGTAGLSRNNCLLPWFHHHHSVMSQTKNLLSELGAKARRRKRSGLNAEQTEPH